MTLVKIDPSEYGLEENKAKQISEMFKPMLDKMVELEKEANEIFKLPIDDPETAVKAKECHKKYVKVRTGTDKIHKKLKAFYLNGGRFVDGWKRAQRMASEGNEERLMERVKYQENLENERKEKLKEEREKALEPYEVSTEHIQLGELSEDVWNNYFNGVKLQFEQQKEAERKAEEERLERERIESLRQERQNLIQPVYDFFEVPAMQKLGELSEAEFNKHLSEAKSEKEKHEAEQEQIRKENERLRKEAEEKERLAQKAEQERQAKEEKERKEYEAKLKAEREEKERVEKELQAKKEAEEKAEAERLAAKEAELAKGDKEKFSDFLNDLKSLTTKYSFKSKKYKTAYSTGTELINKTINHLS